MNDLLVKDDLIQKRTEGIQEYRFQCYRNNKVIVPNKSRSYKACFATSDSLVKTIDMQITEAELEFSSNQLLDLPAGDYQLEIREIVDDKIHAIYPSDRTLTFHIKQNNDDLPVGTVSSLTLDEFVSEFKRLIKVNSGNGTGANVSIDVNKRIITVNDESLTIPEAVDVSKLASKADLQALSKQIAGAGTVRRGPTGFYVRRISNPDGTAKDYEHVLDNGCIIHGIGGGTMGGVGFYTKEYETNFSSYPIMSNIMSFAHGGITIEKLRNKHGIEYVYFNGNLIVENPINDSSKWDWSNVFFNDEDRKTFNDNPGSWGTPGGTKGTSNYGVAGDSWLIKCWYEIGLLDDNEIKSFGAVKKKEG